MVIPVFFVSFAQIIACFMDKRKVDRHVLTITGSDGTGGAGIQSDIKTIAQLGGLPLTAITTVTMQNTLGIQEFFDLPANVLEQQVEAIMDDICPAVVKVGMLRNEGQVKAVVRMMRKYSPQWIVYDPVDTTTRGERLYSEELSAEITGTLLPVCHIVVRDLNVQSLVDWERHGVRSIFSASIAAYLAQGMTKEAAVGEAAAYVNRQAALAGNIEGRGAELYNELLNLIAEHQQPIPRPGDQAHGRNITQVAHRRVPTEASQDSTAGHAPHHTGDSVAVRLHLAVTLHQVLQEDGGRDTNRIPGQAGMTAWRLLWRG